MQFIIYRQVFRYIFIILKYCECLWLRKHWMRSYFSLVLAVLFYRPVPLHNENIKLICYYLACAALATHLCVLWQSNILQLTFITDFFSLVSPEEKQNTRVNHQIRHLSVSRSGRFQRHLRHAGGTSRELGFRTGEMLQGMRGKVRKVALRAWGERRRPLGGHCPA